MATSDPPQLKKRARDEDGSASLGEEAKRKRHAVNLNVFDPIAAKEPESGKRKYNLDSPANVLALKVLHQRELKAVCSIMEAHLARDCLQDAMIDYFRARAHDYLMLLGQGAYLKERVGKTVPPDEAMFMDVQIRETFEFEDMLHVDRPFLLMDIYKTSDLPLAVCMRFSAKFRVDTKDGAVAGAAVLRRVMAHLSKSPLHFQANDGWEESPVTSAYFQSVESMLQELENTIAQEELEARHSAAKETSRTGGEGADAGRQVHPGGIDPSTSLVLETTSKGRFVIAGNMSAGEPGAASKIIVKLPTMTSSSAIDHSAARESLSATTSPLAAPEILQEGLGVERDADRKAAATSGGAQKGGRKRKADDDAGGRGKFVRFYLKTQ